MNLVSQGDNGFKRNYFTDEDDFDFDSTFRIDPTFKK